jgi:hypothetical protein
MCCRMRHKCRNYASLLRIEQLPVLGLKQEKICMNPRHYLCESVYSAFAE